MSIRAEPVYHHWTALSGLLISPLWSFILSSPWGLISSLLQALFFSRCFYIQKKQAMAVFLAFKQPPFFIVLRYYPLYHMGVILHITPHRPGSEGEEGAASPTFWVWIRASGLSAEAYSLLMFELQSTLVLSKSADTLHKVCYLL